MSTHNGRVVRILTFDNLGLSTEALWWAVVDDDTDAVAFVMRAVKTLADQGVTVAGRLDPAVIRAHGLVVGFVGPAKS